MGFIGSALYYVITLGLVAIFVFAGSAKITPVFAPDLHKQLTEKGPAFAAIFQKILDDLQVKFTIDPTLMMRTIGATEVVAGLWLLGNRFVAPLAALKLMGIMAGAIFVHVQLQEDFTPPAVLLGALIVRSFLTPSCCASKATTSKAKKNN